MLDEQASKRLRIRTNAQLFPSFFEPQDELRTKLHSQTRHSTDKNARRSHLLHSLLTKDVKLSAVEVFIDDNV